MAGTKYEIDASQAVIDDLEHFDNPTGAWMVDFLDRVVVGGVRGKGVPLSDMSQIMDAIKEEMGVGGTERSKN